MNKEQLEKLSDFEINKAIACTQGMDYSGVTEAMIHDYNMRDYCNNWSDMGPLITNSKIDIYFDISGVSGAYNNGIDVEHDNPLRAAAIVYLLIKGKS